MMLPNMGKQNFHSTVDGLPVVKSLFMGSRSPSRSNDFIKLRCWDDFFSAKYYKPCGLICKVPIFYFVTYRRRITRRGLLMDNRSIL